MQKGRFRIGLLTLGAATAFSGSAHALDDLFYIAPMASYDLADNDRHSKDGIGGTLALGTRLAPGTEIELLGRYLDFKGKGDTDNKKIGAGGVGLNFFGFDGTGPYLHAGILADSKPELDIGVGFYLLGSSGFGLRAEALYHNQDVDKFREPLFNLGLRIPVGHVAKPAPPPAEQPAPVAVVPAPPPPPVCSNGGGDDGDGKVDYPADPGCSSADDMDETDPPPPPAPACPPPAPGQPVTLEGCKAGDVIVLRGVNFDFDKATLTVNAKTILDEVANALTARPDIKFEIGGHTDSKGSDAYNLKLSDKRAASVATYLQKKGIAKSRMTSKGYGESMPVADNESDAGRELNRRVELKITDSAGGGVTVAPPVPSASAPATLAVEPSTAPAPAPPAAPAAAPAAGGGSASVSIANFAFAPETLTVAPGTTVTWTNSDGSGHSVKFDDTGDSGKFGSGGTYKRTFDKPGEYPYVCGIHSTMKGKVIVQ